MATGRTSLIVLFLVACLLGSGHGTATAATLTLEIQNTYPEGQTFVCECAPFWVYVATSCCDRSTVWRLVAARGRQDEDPTRNRFDVEVAPGRYYVEILVADPAPAAGFHGNVCSPVSVDDRTKTRLRIPDECHGFVSGHRMPEAPTVALPLKDFWQYADDLRRSMEENYWRCVEPTTALADARNRLDTTAPSRPTVVLEFDHPRSLGKREFDARQIRLLVETVKARCWTWLRNGFPDRVTNEPERQLNDALKAFAQAKLRTLDGYKEIADRLERVDGTKRRSP